MQPPSSLMDSTTSPKVKITKGEGVGVHSLLVAFREYRGVLELRDATRMSNKQFNYSHGFTQTKQQVG
jgi:hypothetical protein